MAMFGKGYPQRAPDRRQATYRAYVLPYGEFDDGSAGLAWPQMALDIPDLIRASYIEPNRELAPLDDWGQALTGQELYPENKLAGFNAASLAPMTAVAALPFSAGKIVATRAAAHELPQILERLPAIAANSAETAPQRAARAFAHEPPPIDLMPTLAANSAESAAPGIAVQAAQREAPVTVRAYHATRRDFNKFDENAAPFISDTAGLPLNRGVYAGDLRFANKIAADGIENARVIPLDVEFKNPIRTNFDADGAELSSDALLQAMKDIPPDIQQQLDAFSYYGPDGKYSPEKADTLAAIAKELEPTYGRAVSEVTARETKRFEVLRKYLEEQGFDGVVNNVGTRAAPEPEYVAWKPGTLRNALTGEVMFANHPNALLPYLMLEALQRQEGQP